MPSFGGLLTVAIWPILMNWHHISSVILPAAQCVGFHVDLQALVHRFLATWTGFLLVSIVLTFALLQVLYNAWNIGQSLVLDSWSTKCSISKDSIQYDYLMDWLSRHPAAQSLTEFIIPGGNNQDENDELTNGIDFGSGEDSLDIGQLSIQAEPRWMSSVGKIHFWHQGAYFWFRELNDTKITRWGRVVPNNYLDVCCLTWNRQPAPMKDLFTTVQKYHADTKSKYTLVHGPIPNVDCIAGFEWDLVCCRTKRSLHTVFMDRPQMDIIVKDVRSFLSRQGVQWYKEKGLPLRLGYLFNGPPGTGKSSFAFALAGKFGLPIYLLNLSLQSLTDQAVEGLFSTLPFHCIIMLEDIDATKPLQRDAKLKADEKRERVSPVQIPGMATSSPGNIGSGTVSGVETGEKDLNVTLSGLLNAIDGVGATEGRILIMSTNKIEALDEALIRAGRADRIINFTNTSKEQVRNMFIAAYTGTRWQPHTPNRDSARLDPEVEEYTEENINQLAQDFSEKIRGEEFSPALVQQYFKDFRAQPRLALQELDKWMEDPRAYLKPMPPIPMMDDKEPKQGADALLVSSEETRGRAKEICTAADDLVSLDDIGEYREPSCFSRDSEDSFVYMNPRGPLLDISLFAESY